MNLRSIDLNLLPVFDAVISEQNLSRAADKVCMSQPAISNAVKRLRLTLDDELFVSTGRGVRPTPKALELREPIRQALEIITSAFDQNQPFDFLSSNRQFVIASTDYVGLIILPEILSEINSLNSSVTVNTAPYEDETLMDDFQFGKIDFAVELNPNLDSKVISKELFQEHAVCIARKGHPKIDDALTVDDYCHLEHVCTTSNKKQTAFFENHLRQHGVVRNLRYSVPNYFNVPEVVCSTEALATVPSRLANKFSEMYELDVYSLPFPTLKTSIYLSWHSNRKADTGSQWLKNLIMDNFYEGGPSNGRN